MNRSQILRIVFFISIIVLLSNTVAISRDYQDSWILEDVTIVMVVSVLVFSFFAVICNDNRLLAIACASFVILLNATPNLKYELFQGTFDSVAHYGYVRSLVSLGHVPNSGFYAANYQDFPGMHIFIGSLSLISGLSINATIKLFTSMISGIIPLMTYFATNRVFEPDIQRFIIVGSGLPTFMSYYLCGTTFALPFYFSIICLILLSLVTKNKRGYALVLLFFVFGLLFSHAVTTLYLISFLVIATLLLKLLTTKEKWFPKGFQNTHVLATVILILGVYFVARLAFESGTILETLTNAGKSVLMGQGSGVVAARFFEVPFSTKVVFFALSHAKDAVIGLLSCAGVLVLFLRLRRENREIYKMFYTFLLCLLSAMFAMLTLQFLSGVSSIGYGRFIDYTIILSPFLVGLFLWHVHNYFSRHRLGSAIVALLLFSCISVSLIQVFPFQPIAPTASVLSTDLLTDEYIFDYRSVNTVYQESMILFAQSVSTNSSRIASDTVTRWQIYGFANDAFINRNVYYSPLENQNLDWDLFLLHYDGKAGPLNEKVENRTSERLTELKDTLGNVVYDNGESFIIVRNH